MQKETKLEKLQQRRIRKLQATAVPKQTIFPSDLSKQLLVKDWTLKQIFVTQYFHSHSYIKVVGRASKLSRTLQNWISSLHTMSCMTCKDDYPFNSFSEAWIQAQVYLNPSKSVQKVQFWNRPDAKDSVLPFPGCDICKLVNNIVSDTATAKSPRTKYTVEATPWRVTALKRRVSELASSNPDYTQNSQLIAKRCWNSSTH